MSVLYPLLEAFLINGDIKANTRQVLENIKEILKTAGAEMDDVVKCTIYLTDLGDFTRMNEVYGEYFRPPYPARSRSSRQARRLAATPVVQ